MADSGGKIFTLREVSPVIHAQWKAAAAHQGITMEAFAIAAINLVSRKVVKKAAEELLRKDHVEKGTPDDG